MRRRYLDRETMELLQHWERHPTPATPQGQVLRYEALLESLHGQRLQKLARQEAREQSKLDSARVRVTSRRGEYAATVLKEMRAAEERAAQVRRTWKEMRVIKERRMAKGGRTGHMTITLAWDTACDLDLHLILPSGEEINFSQRCAGGGQLDVDANVNEGDVMENPVENIFFPEPPAPGSYIVFVENFTQRTGNSKASTKFRVKVEVANTRRLFEGMVGGSASGEKKRRNVCEVQVMPDGGEPVIKELKGSRRSK